MSARAGRARGAGLTQDLAVIILNFNNAEYLKPCFEAVFAALQGCSHEIWLVDNQSTDGSPAYVRARYPQVNVLVTAENGGFSYGNNRGLERVGFGAAARPRPPRFRYVLLLNPDTEVEPAALRTMMAYLDAHAGVGVVGPKMVRPNGELDPGCKRGEPTPAAAFFHMSGLSALFPRHPALGRYRMSHVGDDETADVDSVMGACQLMRGRALKQVGLMDEDAFFMYGEDLDFCVRFRRLGWRVVYLPEAVVLHHKGAATRKQSGAMILEFHRAMAIFHRKHYAPRTPAVINGAVYASAWLLGHLKFALNWLRPPARRYVGSAKPG